MSSTVADRIRAYIDSNRAHLREHPSVLVALVKPEGEMAFIVWPWGQPIPPGYANLAPQNASTEALFAAALEASPPKQPVVIAYKPPPGVTASRIQYVLFDPVR